MDEVGRTEQPDRLLVTPARRRRPWRATVLVVLLTAAAAAFAWYMLTHQTAGTSGGHSRGASGAPQPVGITTARTGDIRIVQDALGTVTPLATVTVRTQIAGQLQTLAFTEGQLVQKGAFLAQIDDRPYQALRAQYQGQLARDQATLAQARADLTRYATLLKQDSIARQQADDQRFLVAQDEGAVRADQALIDAQTLNIAYCHIVAPVSGRVGLRQVDAGNYVQTSDTNGIVVITQLQPISVIFTIAEDVLPQVMAQLAAHATLQVAAYDRANDSQLATGSVATVDNQIDTSTGTVKLRALFDNAAGTLFPNQFVNARLLVDTRRGVVTLPQAAVQHGAQGAFVYEVRQGEADIATVKTGAADGDAVEIADGLAAGAQVVTDGTDRLRDGAPVTVQSIDGKQVAGAATAVPDTSATPHHHRRRAASGQAPAGQAP